MLLVALHLPLHFMCCQLLLLLLLLQIVDPQLDHLNINGSKDEKNMLQGYAAIYAKQISDLLLRMPRPLLLLLKTNDCLRSVDLSLGAPVNTFVITAKTCSRALAEMERQQSPGVGSWFVAQLEMLKVEFVMSVMRLMGLWVSVQKVLGVGPAGRSLHNGGVVYDEAVLEQHKKAADEGIILAAQVNVDADSRAAANAA